jgi:CDP-diacylglycerol--glycerol-3-phosphate 3-phosphatidyltransferase
MSADRAVSAVLRRDVEPLRFSSFGTPPNLVSVGRIVGTTVTLGLFALGHLGAGVMLGLASCLSDHLDGYLARRLNQSSALGALLDQTADSYATAMFLYWLTTVNGISFVALAVFLLREFWVAGLRRQAALAGVEIPSSFLGKLATAVIYWAMFVAAALIVWPPPQPWQAWALLAARGGIIVGLGLSCWTAVRYSRVAAGARA